MVRVVCGDLTNLVRCDIPTTCVDDIVKAGKIDALEDGLSTPTRSRGCLGSGGKLRSSTDSEQGVAQLVAECASDLRDLWARNAEDGRLTQGLARPMLQKFGSMGPPRFATALLSPPQVPPPPPPTTCANQTAYHVPSLVESACSPGQLLTPPPKQHLLAAQRATPSPQQRPSLPPCGIETPRPALTAAEALAEWRSAGDLFPDNAEDAALAELAPTLLRSNHLQSEKYRPSPEAIIANLGEEPREQVVLWLFQVCFLDGLDDCILHLSVLLLDRYCAVVPGPLSIEELHLVVIAILSTAIKVTGGADENKRKLRELLAFLGQNRFDVKAILQAELMVLETLKFEVSTVTPLDLLGTLVLPFGTPPDGSWHSDSATAAARGAAVSSGQSAVACLAKFLLELSFLDINLHYKYPQAVLAAGAVYVSLWCTRARPELMKAVLMDVCACEVDVKLERVISAVRRSMDVKTTGCAGFPNHPLAILEQQLVTLDVASSAHVRELLQRHGWNGAVFIRFQGYESLHADLLDLRRGH